jgi:hypothetical protein
LEKVRCVHFLLFRIAANAKKEAKEDAKDAIDADGLIDSEDDMKKVKTAKRKRLTIGLKKVSTSTGPVLKKKAKSAHNTIKSPPKATLVVGHVDPKGRKAREAASLRPLKDLGSDGEEQDLPGRRYDSEGIEEFIIGPILAKTTIDGVEWCLVHWEGYMLNSYFFFFRYKDSEDSWEPCESVKGVQLDAFMLRASQDEPAPIRPVTKKNTKNQEHLIEKIVGERQNKGGKKEYKVKWQGYVCVSYPV